MPEQVRARALGAFYGLALGDALGMPTQSMSRTRIKDCYGSITTLVDATQDQPIAPGMPAGSVTDDTEQAVLVAKLLIDGDGRIDPYTFADALRAWEAGMISRGSRDLLGPSTKRALEHLDAGLNPQQAGVAGTTNGAAMRVTPVAIANPVGDRLLDAVVQASLVTHNTSLGIAAASAIAAAVSASIDGADLSTALDEAERAAHSGASKGHWVAGGEIAPRIRWAREWVRGMSRGEVAGAVAGVIGTSVAAQESVVAAIALAEVSGDDPFGALLLAAEIGGDTDTIAAVLGAILGAQHGIGGFPGELVGTVRAVNGLDLEPLVDRLLALR
ncbi:ADP-ribosylglycohydrolase family protein [Kibdelosporangium phytohabitans]|uniref:ADP-ribosylglycohydrolase n=1 Tax=Kibdelosporangium phytohabitans TaxID=860235 RepID=A0A0N9I8D7_9PSEU|nr:ADP-ribosylglycohydrolase family protein [Kibdelosporangium phytohabitans]ALG11162.1 ADP-ribosylglycohydrolase [Kibdelosporangium phytohabitans]MBE1462417.1 ADP-ribosylglycohydrolase [Kibdelosporangium phytohabitans]